jgi:hypothetical protein
LLRKILEGGKSSKPMQSTVVKSDELIFEVETFFISWLHD